MSPQDKAKQLVEKYLNLSVNVIHTDCEGDISIAAGTPTQSHAKQCALMEVNALIEQNGELYLFKSCENTMNYYRQKNAELFEVKTEIEKL